MHANPVFQLVRQFALISLVAVTMLVVGCASAGGPAIVVSPVTSPATPRELTVGGLEPGVLASFDRLDPDHRQGVLQAWVAQSPAGSPPVLAEVVHRGNNLVFTPRYPFQPGVQYRVRFDPATLESKQPPIESEFTIPAPPADPVVRVGAVYPSADELPENLLKFYIHFSGPMSRGEAYAHLHLLDDKGQPVAAPFLELGEELWNPDATRFTLFFDPGRIKQGLVPRMELGSALMAGKSYTLVVDAAWHDAEQRPLVQPMKKTFHVGPPDRTQPDPARWQIKTPSAGSSQALVLTFEKSLDHAMLQRVLTVRDEGGRLVEGGINIAQHERQWSFTPQSPWQSRRYVVVVETILEDNAGNGIGRPFEVDLNQQPAPDKPETINIVVDVQ